jgi:hypothetical protein
VDEVPWLTKQHPEIAGYLVALLQRGRAVDVRLITNAQSFLVGNTGLGAGSRNNFDTAHFLGGNPTSGAAMLEMKERDLKELVTRVQEETGQALGKGLGVLRNLESTPKAQPARVPQGTNDFQYYLLGRHDDWQLPEFRHLSRPQMHQGAPTPRTSQGASPEQPHPYWTWDDTALVYRPAPDARIVDAETQEMLAQHTRQTSGQNVQPSPQTEQNPPGEPPDVASDQRPKEYRLSDAEIVQFIAAYKACSNMDTALATLGHGARYRKHASEIIQAHALRAKD